MSTAIFRGDDRAVANVSRFRVGTLQYTRASLVLLFFWLLWGDFIFTIMESVIPSILPLKLKALGASNTIMALIMSTIPCALNASLNPVISFRSDRYRSRWGRRIPFIAATAPFLSLTLAAMGFAPELGGWAHRVLAALAPRLSLVTMTLIVIGVLMVLFQAFNMFVATVFWYLFNDVVPQAFQARMWGLFRVVGVSAGALYNGFVFKHAETHMRAIFVGAAMLYLVAFLLMCWRVKEGEYPPPPTNVDGSSGFLATARTYVRECFGYRLYWLFFFANMFRNTSYVCGGFAVFQLRSLGLTLAQIGAIGGAVGVVGAVIAYPLGILADRHHPVRLYVVIQMAQLAFAPLWLVWLFASFPPKVTLAVAAGISMVGLPLATLDSVVVMPMLMRLLPRERFGQFCSCNALFAAGSQIGLGLVAGGFLDLMRRLFPDDVYGAYFSYRFIPVWQIFFLGVAATLWWLLFREWQRLGADESYVPPGFEETPAPAGHLVAYAAERIE